MVGVYKLAFVDTTVLSVIFEMISSVFSVVVSLDGVYYKYKLAFVDIIVLNVSSFNVFGVLSVFGPESITETR